MRERASNLLVKFARKEWPRIIAAVDVIASVDGIADNLADRLGARWCRSCAKMLSQPDHPVRQDYEGWLQDYIGRLRSDPALAAQAEALKQRAIIIRRCRNTCADCGTTGLGAGRASGKRLAGDGPQAREELREVLSQPDHPVRQDYEGWLQDYIGRLRSDPALAAQAEALKQRAINHPKVQEYARTVDDIHVRLRDPSTPTRRWRASGKRLAGDGPQARGGCGARGAEPAMCWAARRLTGRLRAGVGHIARTVKNWDERHLVDELELSVGRDRADPLQRHAGGRADRGGPARAGAAGGRLSAGRVAARRACRSHATPLRPCRR